MKIVNHSLLKQIIEHIYNKKIPLFIWGGTGIGKSTCVKDVAKELKIECKDIRISQLEPSDLRGLPKVDNGETKWLPPNWLPRDGKGILFFDELNLSVPCIQASCYQLILDRRLGDYILPDGWVVISAGNRLEDKANVFEMPSPLANRFLHVELGVPSINDWSSWAYENKIDTRIIAFLNWKTTRLFGFDAKYKDKAFPTPRTWEMASKSIKEEDYDKHKDLMESLLSSAIGDGTATEMIAFLKLQKKINVEDLIKNPKRVKEIKEIDLKWTLVSSVADYFDKRRTKETLMAVLNILDELDAEYACHLFRMCKYIGGEENTKKFIDMFKSIPRYSERKFFVENNKYMN